MTDTTSNVTIADIELGSPASYDSEISLKNEIELVSRLRKMSTPEFVKGMQGLTDYLHNNPAPYVVDRYVQLLVKVAGGAPSEDAKAGI